MQAISKAKIKLFTSLQAKKYRYRHLRFLIEGKKLLEEAFKNNWPVEQLLVREDKTDWWEENYGGKEASVVSKEIFSQISALQQSEGILAILAFPSPDFCQARAIKAGPGLGFVLDAIQDPGNLGTIMRSLDWFGIKNIYLGPGCVDPLNLKTVRSTMGAIFRMNIQAIDNLELFVEEHRERIFVADMKGEAINQISLPDDALILIGNEANGISPKLKSLRLKSISIPRLGEGESLNAGIAASLIAWEMVR